MLILLPQPLHTAADLFFFSPSLVHEVYSPQGKLVTLRQLSLILQNSQCQLKLSSSDIRLKKPAPLNLLPGNERSKPVFSPFKLLYPLVDFNTQHKSCCI